MAFKLVLTLLCFLRIQELNGQVPLTCTQQTSQLRTELNVLASNARRDLSVALFTINTNIASTRSDIKTAKDALQNKASLAVGSNAKLCKNELETDLLLVDDSSLSYCYNSVDIKSLNMKVSQINIMKGSANLICRTCLNEPTCVDAQIDNTRQQAQNLQQEVSLEAGAVQAESAHCAENAGNGQLQIIQTASDTYDACMQGS